MELRIINTEGQQIEEKFDASFIEPNENSPEVVKQHIRVIRGNQRQGNANTKTRAEVSGGGKKPWRQKGTGRARVGSIRSPLWRGGGIIHGPKSKTWSFDLPKKMRAKSFAYVISDYAVSEKISILDLTNDFDKPNTKLAAKIVKTLDDKNSVILITDNRNLYLSFRNIKNVIVKSAKDVNILDILAKNVILTTRADLDILKERL